MCKSKIGLRRRLLGFAFRLLYNELAWSYDLVSWLVSGGRWRSWQRAALPYLRGQRVLEIACGTGDLLLDLETAGYLPCGLDLSPHMLRIARRKLRRAGRTPRLCRARAQQLPFPDATFHSVAVTFPAPFIRAPSSLAEIGRVLVPGGRLVVVDGARLLARDPWSRFLGWLFAITGQGQPVPLPPDALSQAELVSHRGEERTAHSAVEILIAEKPSSHL